MTCWAALQPIPRQEQQLVLGLACLTAQLETRIIVLNQHLLDLGEAAAEPGGGGGGGAFGGD